MKMNPAHALVGSPTLLRKCRADALGVGLILFGERDVPQAADNPQLRRNRSLGAF
jgi:hypothetical protein